MKGQLRINQVFVFVIVDEDGTEGVPAVIENGTLMPLMGADMARVDSLKELVMRDPMFRGRRITIKRFSHREQIGTIDRTAEPPVPAFHCPRCHGISYNPNDIANRYCGLCHEFFDA